MEDFFYFVGRLPFDLILAIGIAALAMGMFANISTTTSRLAAAGRMALTNYLATSVIFAALFAGWGLGLFGKVSRIEALLLALIPIALMLLWSRPWLSVFRQGPAEWLWRSAASGRRLPFKR